MKRWYGCPKWHYDRRAIYAYPGGPDVHRILDVEEEVARKTTHFLQTVCDVSRLIFPHSLLFLWCGERRSVYEDCLAMSISSDFWLCWLVHEAWYLEQSPVVSGSNPGIALICPRTMRISYIFRRVYMVIALALSTSSNFLLIIVSIYMEVDTQISIIIWSVRIHMKVDTQISKC